MKTAFIYHASWVPGLHLGAARLALLNYLYAKKHGGSCVLICNDIASPPKPFHDSLPMLLEWLNIRWGEGPYHNVHFRGKYREVVERLLSCNLAYYDYATPEEIHSEQQAARKSKEPFLYSRLYEGHTPTDCRNWEAEGRKAVIRLRMPRTDDETYRYEEAIMDDMIYDRKITDLATENDYVIQRTDGSYTTYLTQAVDYDLHNIDVVFRDINDRASLAAETFIARWAGLKQPKFGHIPYFAGPVGSHRFSPKHDKDYARHVEFCEMLDLVMEIDAKIPTYSQWGVFHPCYVRFYEKVGFLPEAVSHYLYQSLLKTSVECDSRPLTASQMASKLELDSVDPGIKQFDTEALEACQREAMKGCGLGRKAKLIHSLARSIRPFDYKRDFGGVQSEAVQAFKDFAESQDLFLIGEAALRPNDLPCGFAPEPTLEEDAFTNEGCPHS